MGTCWKNFTSQWDKAHGFSSPSLTSSLLQRGVKDGIQRKLIPGTAIIYLQNPLPNSLSPAFLGMGNWKMSIRKFKMGIKHHRSACPLHPKPWVGWIGSRMPPSAILPSWARLLLFILTCPGSLSRSGEKELGCYSSRNSSSFCRGLASRLDLDVSPSLTGAQSIISQWLCSGLQYSWGPG